MSIFGTGTGVASACFLDVAATSTGTTDCIYRGKLAIRATWPCSVVANSSLSEPTCRPVTAITAGFVVFAAVAIFTFLDNAVSAFTGCDGGYVIIIHKTTRFHVPRPDHGADIPNSTG